MKIKIKEWDYMGKKYRWTKNVKYQGYIECTCRDCQKTVRRLIEIGELEQIKINTDKEKFKADCIENR